MPEAVEVDLKTGDSVILSASGFGMGAAHLTLPGIILLFMLATVDSIAFSLLSILPIVIEIDLNIVKISSILSQPVVAISWAISWAASSEIASAFTR